MKLLLVKSRKSKLMTNQIDWVETLMMSKQPLHSSSAIEQLKRPRVCSVNKNGFAFNRFLDFAIHLDRF